MTADDIDIVEIDVPRRLLGVLDVLLRRLLLRRLQQPRQLVRPVGFALDLDIDVLGEDFLSFTSLWIDVKSTPTRAAS